MIDNGDVAKMGPYAVTVYLVIKSHTNFARLLVVMICGLGVLSTGAIGDQAGKPEFLNPAKLKLLLPTTFFYAGQAAPVQLRNSAGVVACTPTPI